MGKSKKYKEYYGSKSLCFDSTIKCNSFKNVIRLHPIISIENIKEWAIKMPYKSKFISFHIALLNISVRNVISGAAILFSFTL